MKILTYIAIGLLISSLFGCEDNNTTNILEDRSTVRQTSPSFRNQSSDEIYRYNTGDWDIIATKKTQIFHSRASCSGLQGASPSDVRIGDIVFFTYKVDDVDYGLMPPRVRARTIEAYNPNCITNTPIELPSNPCVCNVCSKPCTVMCPTNCIVGE